MEKIITKNSTETKNLGKKIAEDFSGGEIICLSGDLGSGKTTFTQGLLEGLNVAGPYTSPTFAILKEYELGEKGKIEKIYHIDTYRVGEKDIVELGWKDFAGNENFVTIVEWAEKIKTLIPISSDKKTIWINFKWINENEREVVIS